MAVNVVDEPTDTVAVAGVIVTVVGTCAATVTLAVALIVPLVAVTVAVPLATPATAVVAPDEVTVTIPLGAALHATGAFEMI